MKALMPFLAAIVVLYTSSVGAVPVSPEADVHENGKSVFYCETLDDALFIAVQEEESLFLEEDDMAFIDRIIHLIFERRCTVDSFQHIEGKTLCQWYGVVVANDPLLGRIFGRKYIVKVKESKHAPPFYIVVTERDSVFSQSPPTVPQCSSVEKSR